MKRYYRVEHPLGLGLLRNADGTYNPVFPHLTDGKSKDIPMPDNPIYKADGMNWFSTTENYETLLNWFSEQDIKELKEYGYKVMAYLFDDDSPYVKKLCDVETIIVRDKAIGKEEV